MCLYIHHIHCTYIHLYILYAGFVGTNFGKDTQVPLGVYAGPYIGWGWSGLSFQFYATKSLSNNPLYIFNSFCMFAFNCEAIKQRTNSLSS